MGHRALANLLAFFLILGSGLWSAGCAGGQTGEGPPRHLGGDDRCDETTRDIALDDDSALGFAPQRLLDLSRGPTTEPLYWRDPDPEFPFGPEAGVGSITFDVTPTDVSARYLDSVPKPDSFAGEEDCPDHVEVDVVLGVHSEGGALDESVAATLVASDSTVATFDVTLDPATLGGTFAFGESSLGDGTMKLPLRGAFSDYGASGVLDLLYEEVHGNQGSGAMGTIASWPTEEACSPGYSYPFDRGEASVQAGLDLVAAAAGLVLVTPDGQRIAVELGVMDDGGPACLAVNIAPGSLIPAGSLFTPIVLSVVTADGAIENDFQGTLAVVAASDGSFGEATIDAFCNGTSATDFSTYCGDWGVDPTGYVFLDLRAALSFRPPTDAPEVDGTFTIQGTTPPPVCYDPGGGDDGSDCRDDSPPVDVAVIHLERE